MKDNQSERFVISPELASSLCSEDPGAVAHALASLGISVFPVHTALPGGCSCGRDCGRNAGKHPRTPRGLLDATCDPDQIRAWWRRWPDANVAIATGSGSGIWVLDVDAKPDGLDTLVALAAERGDLPETWAVQTGGGGVHLWFTHLGGALPSSASKVGPGLDVRGEGGYVIGPSAQHRSGRRYAWDEVWQPGLVSLAPAPAWLVALARRGRDLVPPDPIPYGPDDRGDHGVVPIPEGGRNDALTRLAGAMQRRGSSEAAIRAALLAENAARCVPPLAEDEVLRIVRSIGRYPPANDVAIPLCRSASRPRAGGFVEFVNGKAVQR